MYSLVLCWMWKVQERVTMPSFNIDSPTEPTSTHQSICSLEYFVRFALPLSIPVLYLFKSTESGHKKADVKFQEGEKKTIVNFTY